MAVQLVTYFNPLFSLELRLVFPNILALQQLMGKKTVMCT